MAAFELREVDVAAASRVITAALARLRRLADVRGLRAVVPGNESSGLLAAAIPGRETDLDAMLAAPERILTAMRGGPMLAPANLARGAAALSEGRHDDAFHALWPVFNEDDPAFHSFMRWPAVLDLVEASGHGEHAPQIAKVIADLEEVARRSDPPILRAGLVCARPLMSDDDHAHGLFMAALGQESQGYPFLRARTLLSYGCWLRRRRRTADSRAPLRDASKLFDALRATGWTERAREELRATGEKIGPRTPDARDRLTDCPGATDRRAGGRRPVESRDRRTTVPLPPNHRIAPLPDLPETGNHSQDATSRRPYTGRGPGAQLTESGGLFAAPSTNERRRVPRSWHARSRTQRRT